MLKSAPFPKRFLRLAPLLLCAALDATPTRADETAQTHAGADCGLLRSFDGARAEQEKKRLAELEAHIQRSLAELEKRRLELQQTIDRLNAFMQQADDSLVNAYGRMKPEAAAEKLDLLEEEGAAALLLKLKPKVMSAILEAMEPAKAAATTRKIIAISKSARLGKN